MAQAAQVLQIQALVAVQILALAPRRHHALYPIQDYGTALFDQTP
jgi:hypothetical protein